MSQENFKGVFNFIRSSQLWSRSSDSPPLQTLALDVSLEKARALHRVWRALNDGDCPKCHTYHEATEMKRRWVNDRHDAATHYEYGIMCPSCMFKVTVQEIEAIEKLFAPAMDAAVKIFEEWRQSR